MESRSHQVGPTATTRTGATVFDSHALDLEICRRQIELKSKLLESIGDGITAYTPTGTIVYSNEQAASALGYSIGQFACLPPWGWLAPRERATLDHRFTRLRLRESIVYESTCLTREGEEVTFEVHARLIALDPWGEVVVCVSRSTAPRSAEQETIRRLAFCDPLTGLCNRALLQNRLASALTEAQHAEATVGIIYVDLDDFKPVNDTHGHAMGDRVLRIISERLLNCVRDSDTVARVGGDEFVVLFPNLGSGLELTDKARSISECIAGPIAIDGITVQVSASVGLAVYRTGEHHDEFISRADHAMYRAKLHGRAGWEEYLERA